MARRVGQGAVAFAQAAQFIQLALVDGYIGLIQAPGGKLQRVLRLWFKEDRVGEVEIIGDAARLAQFDLAVLGLK